MNKLLPIFGLIAVLVFGFAMAPKQPVVQKPEPAAKDAAAADGTAGAAGQPAAAPAAPAGRGQVIVYNIQACVDEKATLVIEGDHISWEDVTGEGLHGDGCQPEMRDKTLVTSTYNGEGSSWPDSFDVKSVGAIMGPLTVPLPPRETVLPPNLQVLDTNAGVSGQGSVKIVEVPRGPRYRIKLAFDDPKPKAHTYTVDLTLEY